MGAPGGVQEITYTVPADKCGLVIGKGECIAMQVLSAACCSEGTQILRAVTSGLWHAAFCRSPVQGPTRPITMGRASSVSRPAGLRWGTWLGCHSMVALVWGRFQAQVSLTGFELSFIFTVEK